MKLFNIITTLIFISSFSLATQVTQKKKILTYFDVPKENEKTVQEPTKKKQSAKLIKLFDDVPEEPLPAYQSVTLDKYYSKERPKPTPKPTEQKASLSNLPFSTPDERINEIKEKEYKSTTTTTVMPFSTQDIIAKNSNVIIDEEELDRINSETVTTTTLANLFGDDKEEVEQFPKGANYYDKITKMIRKSISLIGSAYKFGASAGGNTYDCSLFTQTIFKKIGINIPRTSIEQSSIGKKISKKDLVIGDLLFFATYRKSPSHVGIYIGDNKMIHASTKNGVTISDLDMNYYQRRYLFAKRPNFQPELKLNN